ncbi:MAG TPA: signal recognition particle-docking protein FtsY [Actinomycetota bacterium]|nr:signal recognition particle-docking protein FtsY [Actinomycetota bacterium]
MAPLLVVAVALVVVVVLLVVVFTRRGGRSSTATPAAPRTTRAAPAAPSGSAGGFGPSGLGARVRAAWGSSPNGDAWAGLEDVLLKADVGPQATADLIARLRARGGGDPVDLLREEIVAVLGPERPVDLDAPGLDVILVVGVNGSGKTTTIGKLASRLVRDGKRVSLAAADTFRAAAGEQLAVWAQRSGAQLVSQDRGADPSAVAFDAVTSATARQVDVLLVDTAGRLHTKEPLMQELAKVKRVIEKAGGVVTETLLVLDAQTGQNGIAQARAFTDAVDVTGVVLTKTDGSARGGMVLAVREELDLPIRYVGVGEGPDDLRPFDPAAFADRLLA